MKRIRHKWKFEKGLPIQTVEELSRQEFVIFNDKVYHRGWIGGWQFGWVVAQINRGRMYQALPPKEIRAVQEMFGNKTIHPGYPQYKLPNNYSKSC